MTLIVSLATPHYVLQVSDRRITNLNTGEPMDSATNKVVIFHGRVAFGFTGLATLEGRSTDIWLTEFLSDHVRIETPLQEISAKLAERAKLALSKSKTPEKSRHLAFVAAGWMPVQNDWTSAIFAVENFDHTNGAANLPHKDFKIQSDINAPGTSVFMDIGTRFTRAEWLYMPIPIFLHTEGLNPNQAPSQQNNIARYDVYSAIRLPSGNTLIGCGDGHRAIEVDPTGQIVWSVGEKDLPGITLAWVTMVERLPDGNTIIVNCHAGPDNPQIIEVTPERRVVWTFRDFDRFGNSMPVARVLDAGK